MEGLYIHNLLMFALFSDNGSIILYVALGWGKRKSSADNHERDPY